MKKIFYIFALSLLLFSCRKVDRNSNYDDINFKEEMRQFVIGISQYAKNIKPGFDIIVQNGVELVTQNGEENSVLHQAYLNAIDGQGQEELNFGYDTDDMPTPSNIHQHLKHFLDLEKSAGKKIFVTDYCSTPANIAESYQLNAQYGYTGYAAISRELDVIPAYIQNENNADIIALDSVQNFLYLINPANYSNKQDLINTLSATDFDMIIMDWALNRIPFTATELNQIKHKHNGGERKLIAYVSIGEAENYRYYWKNEWNVNKPFWIEAENPDWPGNYIVKYWEKQWQDIIYGNNQSYIKKVMDAGFDGVYLDIIDAYDFFEERYD